MKAILFALALAALPVFCAGEAVLLKDGSKFDAVKVTEEGGKLAVQTKYGNFVVNKVDVANLEALGFSENKKSGGPKTEGLEFISELLPDLVVKVDYFSNRKKTGTQRYTQTGELVASEGEVADGTYKEFFPDGRLKKEKTMIDGQNNGSFRAFFPDGTLQSEGYFINGKMNGGHKIYSDAGRLMIERNYINGVPNGYFREYDDKGLLKSQTQYRNGELVAPEPEFQPVAVPPPAGRAAVPAMTGETKADAGRVFFIEAEVLSVGGADKEWEKNYNEALNFFRDNLDYVLGEYNSYPGVGATVGVNLAAYKDSPMYLAASYVKGPSADLSFTLSDSYWGSGTYTEDLSTSYFRFLLGYKLVLPLEERRFFVLDFNAGYGSGKVESEWSTSGSLLGSDRGTLSETWSGFTWSVGPTFSWANPGYIFELGGRYTVYPALEDGKDFSDIKWRPFSLKASLMF